MVSCGTNYGLVIAARGLVIPASPQVHLAKQGTRMSETAQTRVLYRTRLRPILWSSIRCGVGGVGILVSWTSRPFFAPVARRWLLSGRAPLSVSEYGRFLMRTILLILGIWLLINILFVIAVVPSHRPRSPPRGSEGPPSPAPINKTVHRLEDGAPPSLQRAIALVAGRAACVLVLPFVHAIKPALRTEPS